MLMIPSRMRRNWIINSILSGIELTCFRGSEVDFSVLFIILNVFHYNVKAYPEPLMCGRIKEHAL